jgi:hypothetical protein
MSLLWLPLSAFFTFLGHHCTPLVTAFHFFYLPRASLLPFGYHFPLFQPSSGIIALLRLPIYSFSTFLGHHCTPLVTDLLFFNLPRASLHSFGYRFPLFLPFSGIIALLWLPFSSFFTFLGHHSHPLVTDFRFFYLPRASLLSFDYRFPLFLPSSGTIALLCLPIYSFFTFLGHHCTPLVTAFLFFNLPRAS